MAKRMVLLTAGLWLAIYASQALIRTLFDLAHASVIDGAWVILVSQVLCTVVGAWLVGRWRGVAGRRLVLVSLAACLAAFVVWLATGAALLALPSVDALAGLGDVATIVLSLVYALEAAALSWLIAGWVGVDWDAHRTSAST